jgi:hypothetical protein
VFKSNPKKLIKAGIGLCVLSLFLAILTWLRGDTNGSINAITTIAVGGYLIYLGRRKLREQKIAEEFKDIPKIGPLDF